MQLFGLEISKVPKRANTIWTRPELGPIGVLVTELTPDELRRELTWVVQQLNGGAALHVSSCDPFRRILSSRR
jgi:hypothetical protein